jgi:flavorubredoxin
MTARRAAKISDTVYWVGAIDWNLRNFHGYLTSRGTTYNAYLVMADKVTLIDTVKPPFREEMLARIRSVVPLEKIDYIVSNHAELDHSGCLPELMALARPEKVIASKQGIKALQGHFAFADDQLTQVDHGEEIDLGSDKLTAFSTRMLHWPDSMMTYLHGEKILFSQDGFGMHLASSERFDDELPKDLLEYEAAKYFANVLLCVATVAQKAIDKILDADLEIALIAPDHGPIWRTHREWILDRYEAWAAQVPQRKAVIVYDTMWESTEKMAHAVADGLSDSGATVKLMSLQSNHRSDIMTEVLSAGALVVGSPTINNQLYPTVADCLTYIRGLRPKNMIGAAFGSYGWSGESVKLIEEELEKAKIEKVADGLKVEYVPTADDIETCYELGRQVAARLPE